MGKFAYAQDANLSGKITEANTNDILPFAIVVYEDGKSNTADYNGEYSLTLAAGMHIITFKFTGKNDSTIEVKLLPGESRIIDIALSDAKVDLGEVIISSNLSDKKQEKEVQRVNVLKPDAIQNRVSVNLQDAIKVVSGLQVIDGQPSIRGGSGYAYGTGSRVMVVVDGLPMLSADRGDVQWNFIPIENARQIEIVKGSSSVLYGASALNGVINVNTFDGMEKAYTSVSIYHKIIGPPSRKITQWWDAAPQSIGAFFVHRQRLKQFDFVLGGNLHDAKSHLVDDDEERVRLTWKTRYRSAKIDGLSFGLNGNYTRTREGYFIIWQNAEEGIMRPSGGTSGYNDYRWINVDPWVTYFDKYKNKHSFKSRYYRTQLGLDASADYANLFMANYTFSHTWKDQFTLTTGVSSNGFKTFADDYGSHTGLINALFAQYDMNYKKLVFSAGTRMESFILDGLMLDSKPSFRAGNLVLTASSAAAALVAHTKPSFRAGINLGPWRKTTMRLSFGQGYRIPSFVEKYIDYKVGDLINIFPNRDLRPEYGWSSELGAMKSFKAGKINGFFDASVFLSEYKDMVEFSFDLYPEQSGSITDKIGFKSLNIAEARIAGIELGIDATSNEGKLPINFTAGYTYLYPVDLNYDPNDTTIRNYGVYARNFFRSFSHAPDSLLKPTLKYRFRHSATADIEVNYKKWKLGGGLNYYSYMEHIDSIFTAQGPWGSLLHLLDIGEPIPGLRQWRDEHNDGVLVSNVRLSYNVTDRIRVLFKVDNITNREYAIRPAMLEAPRNYTLQYKVDF